MTNHDDNQSVLGCRNERRIREDTMRTLKNGQQKLLEEYWDNHEDEGFWLTEDTDINLNDCERATAAFDKFQETYLNPNLFIEAMNKSNLC